MAHLDGQVALITGGGSGIGFACAHRLALDGARLVLAGRTASKLEQAAQRLASEGLAAAIVLQIHDELLLEVPAGEVETVRRLLVEEMKGAMTLAIPLEVTVHEGATWAECEK